VLPALLAFSTYAATAADRGRAAREVARSVLGLNAEASAISDQEVAAPAHLLLLELHLGASATPLTPQA
jgi:hypothetical protein